MQKKFIMRASIQLEHKAKPLDLNKVKRLDSGAAVFNVKPMRSGDYQYMAYELGDWENPDDIVTGNISDEMLPLIAEQFEGLPVTNDHVFISPENTGDVVGSVLQNAVIETDGYLAAKLVITNPIAIENAMTGKKIEVSIGFYGDITDIEDGRFTFTSITLNHLALVEQGRAGERARLYHQKHPRRAKPMPKIKLGNLNIEVDDALAEAAQAEIDSMQLAHSTLKEQISTLQGENAALKKEAEKFQNHDPVAEAQKLLMQHTALLEKLEMLGVEAKPELGKYVHADVLRDALTKYGVDGLEGKSESELSAVYHGMASVLSKKQDKGALEGAQSEQFKHSDFISEQDAAQAKVHNHWFNRKAKKQEAK